jgi:hypothetical protein
MSEADSTPSRRPPTIDLTAKEVETERPDSAAAGAADEAAKGNASAGRGDRNYFGRATPFAIGVVVGAVAVAASIAGFWVAGFAPVHETAVPPNAAVADKAAVPSAQGAKSADIDEINARLDKLQQALRAPRTDEALAARVTAAEAQTKSLGDTLAGLTRRVDDVAAAAQTALTQAQSATASAEAAKSAAQAAVRRTDIDALTNRIAALESAVKSLSAEVAQRTSSSNSDDRVTRATVAAEALRSAVERGASYQAELAAVQALGADQAATAPLASFAADGVPSIDALGRELAALTPALHRASEPEPDNSSILGRLEAHAQKLVRITPLETSAAPAGDDPSSVIARINGEGARGDIAAALADIARLPAAARSLAEGWAKKAEAREAAIAASRRIAADALAALGKPVSQ